MLIPIAVLCALAGGLHVVLTVVSGELAYAALATVYLSIAAVAVALAVRDRVRGE